MPRCAHATLESKNICILYAAGSRPEGGSVTITPHPRKFENGISGNLRHLIMTHIINFGSPKTTLDAPQKLSCCYPVILTVYRFDWPGIVSGGIPLIWTFCLCMVGWRSSEGWWKAECATNTTVFLLSGQCLVMAWTSWWIWSTYT